MSQDERLVRRGIRQHIRKGASFSGFERDRVYFQRSDHSFVDLSGVSGLDLVGDGRSFAFLDLDHDGRQDVAVVSANAPLLQVMRNGIPEAGSGIAIQLEGGNQKATVDGAWSNRDGVGARVFLTAGGTTQLREHHVGEGLAAQNSSVLWIGMGEAEHAERVTVRWPSGRTQSVEAVPAGSVVTFRERFGAEVGDWVVSGDR